MMKELISKIEQAAEEKNFSGVVSLQAADSELNYKQGFGWRDVQNQLPNLPNTKFGIASGTKFFTALAIGKLIDQKELGLETTIGEIFADRLSYISPDATIKQLLCHTSGIYDYLDEELITDFDNLHYPIPWYQLENPSDYLPLFDGETPKFKPGERFSYSNGGFVFLGVIIEKLSGMLYRDFVEQQILNPAGMADSGFYAFNQPPPNTANGYLEDGVTTNIFSIPIRGGGDGGMFTTAADIDRCWRKFMHREILSAELTQSFIDTQVDFDGAYGYGLGIWKDLGNNVLYLVGGDAGVGFHSRYLLETHFNATVFSNITEGEGAMVETVLELVKR